jgi:beta-glucosidase
LGLEGAKTAAKAMNAGADLEFPHPNKYLLLKKALADESVSEEQFTAAVKRALTLKARMGLLDETDLPVSQKPLEFDPPAYRSMAYTLAAQSVVLLKNKNILPLSKQIKKVALMGPNADAVQSLLGDYTYQSMTAFFSKAETQNVLETPHLVTLREGLQNKATPAGMSVLYERGCDWNKRTDININSCYENYRGRGYHCYPF